MFVKYPAHLLIALLLAGCGPTAQEVATMTAAAWTPTPPPTATPIPYDLTMAVVGAGGQAIPWATVRTAGSNEGQELDAEGQLRLGGLPNSDFAATIAAQGFITQDISMSLERGPNELEVQLEPDPYGVLPSSACAPGEALLYVEDFQDTQAQGWPQIEFRAQGWSIADYAEEPGNAVASYAGDEHQGSALEGIEFSDAVWRLRYRVDGRRVVSFNWLTKYGFELEGQHIDDARYQTVVDRDFAEIRRLTLPVLNLGVSRGTGATAGAWHNVEISTYQGHTQLWLDGKPVATYTDPKPLPPGTIGLELLPSQTAQAGTVISFDSISVCGLSAPFTSMYAAPQ